MVSYKQYQLHKWTEKTARARNCTKMTTHPVCYAYWRVWHPHELYVSGCGMKNEDVIWVLEIRPTLWGGVAGKNVTLL